MVALLAAVRRLVVALGALGVTLATCQLPALGTLHTLVAAWPATGVTAQVALFAITTVAVVAVEEDEEEDIRTSARAPWGRKRKRENCEESHSPVRTRRSAFAALEQESLGALGAVHAGHALGAGVEAFRASARLHEIPFVADCHTLVVLQEEGGAAGETFAFRGPGARFARRVAGPTMSAVRVLSCG